MKPPQSATFVVWTYCALALSAVALVFWEFLTTLFRTWLSDGDFSFGLVIPPIIAYAIWRGCKEFKFPSAAEGWNYGLLILLVGAALQVLASHSGTLLLSAVALALVLVGAVTFLWGKRLMKLVAAPMALVPLMVPLPSYVVGELSWHLQTMASAVSADVLDLLGVPVLRDGKLLHLPNYILEVKQVCSGSRFIFSLLALAFILTISENSKWWHRILLVVSAPVLAVAANVIRIVGTGLMARRWGDLAANESLHAAWGVAVFLLGLAGLVAIDRIVRRQTCRNA